MIKGRINKGGYFEKNRAGVMKTQKCMHREMSCGDHCPLFMEPDTNTTEAPWGVFLKICNGRFGFSAGEFEDLRGSVVKRNGVAEKCNRALGTQLSYYEILIVALRAVGTASGTAALLDISERTVRRDAKRLGIKLTQGRRPKKITTQEFGRLLRVQEAENNAVHKQRSCACGNNDCKAASDRKTVEYKIPGDVAETLLGVGELR